MCFFGGGGRATPAPKKPEFKDAPPVVKGEQKDVKDPIDTAKVTEQLKLRRKKKEAGTLKDNDRELSNIRLAGDFTNSSRY
tara:strand:- start:54 stop:296 length:243 start_codon:yes stop_codon:yes gene_type:complete